MTQLLIPIPDAHILTCDVCGSQLMARPGDAIAHDDTDGTHVFFPAMTDDLEEPKNDVPPEDDGVPATDFPDEDNTEVPEDDASTSPEPVTEGD